MERSGNFYKAIRLGYILISILIGCMDKLLKEMGCTPQEIEEGRIKFEYQGIFFLMEAINECKFINLIWPWFHSFSKFDIDEFARVRQVVNDINAKGSVSVIYGITDSDDVAVHIKKNLLLVPQIPDLEDYMKLTLDSFFRTARTLDIEIEKCRFQDKDGYGKNYQILVFIKNLGETSPLFDPSLVTSILTDKYGERQDMKVYTYEQYMKKVKNQQAWSMALMGFSTGMNAGMAGYQTTYTTTYRAGRMPYTQVHTTYNYAAASAANMAATTQMMSLSKMMSDDKKTISQGYLKKNTINPDEGLLGYMNIKYRKGKVMTVRIPVGDYVYSFDWNVSKKKKK